MLVQARLCRTCSETTLLVFPRDGSFFVCFSYTEVTRKLRKNVTEAVTDLMRNFDAEFGVGHHSHGGHFPNRDRGFHGSDEEESSCDSSYNQVLYLIT